jgi:hypothetical protein
VAFLGTSTGPAALRDFHHGWIFMGACALTSCLILQGIGRKHARHLAPEASQANLTDPEPYALAVSR